MLLDAPSVLDAWAFPDQTAAELAQCAPQGALTGVLGELTPATLSVDGRIDALVAVQRHLGLLHAQEAELLAALDASDDTADGFTRDHVAAALRVAPASMRTRMSIASDLTGRLPDTLALLRAGEITQRHALDLADATRPLPTESVAVVEARVLPRAPEQTPAQFRASVRRAVLRVSDAAQEEAAHQQAVSERRVVLIPADRGMAWLTCYLPADSAASLLAAVNAVAHETLHGRGGDPRTADQRRADALTQIACSVLADPHLTRAHEQRPAIGVTVAASTLLGLDDQPAELDGYGAITAAMARRIAHDPTATWRRLLTDDTGLIRSASTRTYRPPTDMTRTVIARDTHCQYPGCRRTAHHSDLDHITAWQPGDQTTTANLLALCRRHHRLKHTGRWKVDRNDATGVTTWTDQRGRHYQSRPPTKPTTTTGTVNARAWSAGPIKTDAMNTRAMNTGAMTTHAANPCPPTAGAADTTSNQQEPRAPVPDAGDYEPPPF